MSSLYRPLFSDPKKAFLASERGILDVFEVSVEGAEYQLCVDHATNMWANDKVGEWGEGLINSAADPCRTERTGTLGEMAFAKVFGLDIDLSYRTGGDSYDFLLEDQYKVNIKSAARNYGKALVKAATKGGLSIKQDADIFVFAFIKDEDRKQSFASVVIVGYERGSVIRSLPLSPAIKGSHQNYQLDYSDLKPIDRLLARFRYNHSTTMDSRL